MRLTVILIILLAVISKCELSLIDSLILTMINAEAEVGLIFFNGKFIFFKQYNFRNVQKTFVRFSI